MQKKRRAKSRNLQRQQKALVRRARREIDEPKAATKPYRRSEHGPLFRLLKGGKITPELFWCGEEFGHLYELAQIPGDLKAQNLMPMPRGVFVAPQEMGGIDTGNALKATIAALDRADHRQRRQSVLSMVLIEVAVKHTPMEDLDTRLRRRKQWTRGMVIEALEVLAKLWARKIAYFKAQVSHGETP